MIAKKRKIEVAAKLDVSAKVAWKFASDVRTYPKFIKFMRKAEINEPFKVGGYWSDISTVMFFPQRVVHKIVEVKKGERVVYLINLPFGGEIVQSVKLDNRGKFILLRTVRTTAYSRG